MRLRYWLGMGCSFLLATSGQVAQALPIELQVFRAIDTQEPSKRCPDTVTVMEQSQPYREGGYTIDGMARLGWLADNFKLATIDSFSVTWVGRLKPQYQQCKATAGVVKYGNDESTRGSSYLRMRFEKGQVFLILDMTGIQDANQLTPVIVRKAVEKGNPVWSWSGTD